MTGRGEFYLRRLAFAFAILLSQAAVTILAIRLLPQTRHWLPWVILGVGSAFLPNFNYDAVRNRQVWLRRKKGQCLNCGYSLTGNTSGICPECGTPVPKAPANQSPRIVKLAKEATAKILGEKSA